MTKHFSPTHLHREDVFEHHIVNSLVKDQDYILRNSADYDRKIAIDREVALDFVQTTQPDAWKNLVKHYNGNAEITFLKQLAVALKKRGPLKVFREGFTIIPKINFRMCYFAPSSIANPKLQDLCDANRFSVIRQLYYSEHNNNSIDVCLFLNGIPFTTMELKKTTAGQDVHDAETQYRTSRLPAKEPLLTFRRGAIVHFALDENRVSMTTRLEGKNTRFLPFNRGWDDGAGNPPMSECEDWPISYLYRDEPHMRAIFSKESLLNILEHFVHEERKKDKTIVLFPRFHQLDAVRAILADAKTLGPGQKYLIQHSAGSGKSNTIAWTAHQLISLHDAQDNPVFQTVVIITDRIVLDRQLQDTVSSLAQTPGVVECITQDSRQLRQTIEGGARIVITTLQKFATENMRELTTGSDRNFAVIADEAHNSQAGDAAAAMIRMFSGAANYTGDLESTALAEQAARSLPSNVSFLAFTATPRNVTLSLFGRSDEEGKPQPFHSYTMKQAIEEGFILDVLQNYMTYKSYYQVEKAITDDPELESRKGKRTVAKFAANHPVAIQQKAEVMVEHFMTHVQPELDGNGKAMVVTASREQALEYHRAIEAYAAQQGYSDVRALVAFSGHLSDGKSQVTEEEINGFSEEALPEQFDKSYQILVVAEKYQTGFDQPKLVGMYVDRKLAGLQAVQTLSRLNRTCAGKKNTYVLDFQNTASDIKAAFEPYYRETRLLEPTDPHLIYNLQSSIMDYQIVDLAEVDLFADRFYRGNLAAQDGRDLDKIVSHAVTRFRQENDPARKEEFRQRVKSFNRFYSFIAQIVNLEDSDLEKLYIYLAYLLRNIDGHPSTGMPGGSTSMLELKAFRLEVRENIQSPTLSGSKEVEGITDFGTNTYTAEQQLRLSTIVKEFNERFGFQMNEEDMIAVEKMGRGLCDTGMQELIKTNSFDTVSDVYFQDFRNAAFEKRDRDEHNTAIMTNDMSALRAISDHILWALFKEIRSQTA
jgi:type I restriction enzyme R subunit